MSPHYLQTACKHRSGPTLFANKKYWVIPIKAVMGYLPDGGIKYKSRNGSKVLFGTPEVRLLLGVPFDKQPDNCGCVIRG
jgi:hypothetical protein